MKPLTIRARLAGGLLTLLLGAAGALNAAEPDLTTPAVRVIRTDYLQRRAAIEQQHAAESARAIETGLESTRQMLARARISGNIPAQAAARTGIQIFSDAQAALAKQAPPALPENVRRELQETVATARRQLTSVDAVREAARRVLESDALVALGEALAKQGTPVAEEGARRELLARLAGRPVPAEPGATEATATPGAKPGEAAASNAVPTTILASGTALEWLALSQVTVEVSALEVLRLPVAGVAHPGLHAGEGPISGQPFSVRWEPLRELQPAGTTPIFRIVPTGGGPVDVAEWPAARNQWHLEVRARPAGGVPSRHRFTLEVGAETAATRPLAGLGATGTVGSAGSSSTNLVRVRFESDPPGAVVSAGGRLLTSNGKVLATPFDYQLGPDAVEIRFRRRGFTDAVYARVVPKPGGVLRARLVADPNYVDQRVSVQSGAKGWQATAIRVRKGQHVRLQALGTWSCGTGGEMVDAGGYPNNDTFFKYYLDPQRHPRLVNGANYGCLLMRVMPGGQPQAASGSSATLQADADGTLAFDINEAPEARRDNRGVLVVQVQIAP